MGMPMFMDIHGGFYGVTQEQVEAAHRADLEIEAAEGSKPWPALIY